MLNAWEAIGPVFYAYAPPDIAALRCEPECRRKQVPHPLRALCEHLIGVPICFDHHSDYVFDIVVGYPWLKEVTHTVHENGSRRRPLKRFGEFLWHESKVETLFVGVAGHSPKSFRERLSVAMFAARTDLGATPKRVPRGVGPLYFGVFAHCALSGFYVRKSPEMSPHPRNYTPEE